MLGGYFMWVGCVLFNINYILSVLISVAAVALLGVILEKLFFKSIRGLLLPGLLIAIGLILVLQVIALLIFGEQPLGIPAPHFLGGVIWGFGAMISKERLAIIIVSLASIVLMYLFVRFTRLGKAMQAVAQNPNLAELQGISIDNISSLAMAIGSALAAVGGCIMGIVSPITTTMGSQQLLQALVVLVIGGLGSIPGTIIAGLIIGLTRGFVSTYVSSTSASIVVFMLLFIVLIFKPRGLLGHG
jgi:branched-chain amino acid transport system permease protein